MSSKNVNKKYLDKIKEFQEHNKLYYDENRPKISDEKFDILKKEILDLETKHKFLKSYIFFLDLRFLFLKYQIFHLKL